MYFTPLVDLVLMSGSHLLLCECWCLGVCGLNMLSCAKLWCFFFFLAAFCGVVGAVLSGVNENCRVEDAA